MRTLAGVVVVAAHAAAFVMLAGRCVGTELTVDVISPNASAVLSIDGVIPPALVDRVTTNLDDGSFSGPGMNPGPSTSGSGPGMNPGPFTSGSGPGMNPGPFTSGSGPGLHRKRWSVKYRGGFERSVGAAQLVGPFQDPAARTCTGRVVVGQRLLDDGKAGPGTLAGELAKVLTTELTGESVFPAGDFRRIQNLSLRWARVEWHPGERRLVGDAPHGYVRAAFEVVLDRVTVPVLVALIPAPATTELAFRVVARAELDFDNRVAQWVSDKLGGNAFVTSLARGQIDGLLVGALAPPPPFELPGGQLLTFTFCNEPPEIFEGVSGALPFAVELGRLAADPTVLPPRRGRSPRLPLAPGHSLAVDLDLDALNALLYELWRGGYLDRELAAAGLDQTFNTDPIVTEFLSLRISPLRLALPPVLAPSAHGLRLSAEGRVAIADGPTTTTGRIWGGLDFRFARAPGEVDVDLGVLELSCEATPTRLVPCYADLVAAIRGRSVDFHGALTATFARILSEIFVERRLGASGLPADLVIRSAVPRLTVSSTNSSLHFDLDATLVP